MHPFAMLVNRSECLRFSRFTSFKYRDAYDDVGRSFNEGTVILAEE